MPLFDKLGLTPDWIDPKSHLKGAALWKDDIAKIDSLTSTRKNLLPSSFGLAALNFYYLDDHNKARRYAKDCVAASLDYLFGDWRRQVPTDHGTLDAKWWNSITSWVSMLGDSVLWSSALGDSHSLAKLAKYPGPGMKQDDSDGVEERVVLTAIAAAIQDQLRWTPNTGPKTGLDKVDCLRPVSPLPRARAAAASRVAVGSEFALPTEPGAARDF